jgi:hypothetical protein
VIQDPCAHAVAKPGLDLAAKCRVWRVTASLDRIEACPPWLEKALERVVALPQDEQDAIASQILAALADEDAWKMRFAEKRDVIRRMAREALEEDARGETLPLDDLL